MSAAPLDPTPEPAFRWTSVSSVRDTVAALESELGPDRIWVGRVVLALVGLGLAAVAWLEIDVTARASGWVRARTETSELRSPATGVVEAVWVRPGQHVAAGQALLQVSDPTWASRRDQLSQRCAELALTGAEWDRLTRAAQDEAGTGDNDLPSFRTAWAARLCAEFLAEDADHQLAEAKARRESDRLERLGVLGLVSERELDDARHEAEARASARRSARQRHLAVWQERRRDTESQRVQAGMEADGLDRQREALVLRAPLEGELLEWVSLEKGSVVMAGQTLGRLTPDEPLLIEAFVPARTAALLHPRQDARASFPALPAAEWGTLALQVEAIASDARWEHGEPLFRVVARPALSQLTTRDGRSQPLRKGFVAEVRFHLGRTTLFQFLRTKTTDWIQRVPVARAPAGSVRTTLSLAPRRLHSGRPG